MQVPNNMLIYYGWLNSFNSAVNGWDNEKVAQELAKYDLLVLGDGLQASSHGDYSNTTTIINRIKVLNAKTKIFGYATVYQTYSSFKTKVTEWDTLGVHGIFMDEAGYDYGTVATNSRSEFNKKVDLIHSQSSANICFANAWKIDHVMTREDDTSYPNSTWNPDLLKSNLNSTDWYLLESFAITSTPSFESHTQWLSRGERAKEVASIYGVNLAACSVIDDTDSLGQDKMEFVYISAVMFSLDAVGTSDLSYGASTAKSKLWGRPAVLDIDYQSAQPEIVLKGTSTYCRYLKNSKLEIDFTSGTESVSVDVY